MLVILSFKLFSSSVLKEEYAFNILFFVGFSNLICKMDNNPTPQECCEA